jgi:hypothetical protein
MMKPEDVLIITGRGNQSAGGVGVIRREVLSLMPSLKRLGIVESWKEHSPGSIVVKLARTTALFSAARRRRGPAPERSASGTDGIVGLERETLTLLRQLALNSLEGLGVASTETFVRAEMSRIFSILSAAIPRSERTEALLRVSIRNAIEEGFDSGRTERA